MSGIGIYGIIGFSGFFKRAYSTCNRLSALVLAGFPVMAKRQVGRIEILKNPANPVNPDSDKDAPPSRACILGSDDWRNEGKPNLPMQAYQEGGDPQSALGGWFRAAGLFAGLWIPAFAGMTG